MDLVAVLPGHLHCLSLHRVSLHSLSLHTLIAVLALFNSVTVLAGEWQFVVQGRDNSVIENVIIAGGVPGTTKPIVRKMDQVNKQFVPYVLPIHEGDQVGFPNSDQIRHHVYSFSPAKPFEIKLYSGEPTAPIEFEKPGAIVLGCNIHDNMLGYIFVTDRPVYTMTNADGNATLAAASDSMSIDVWHPARSLASQAMLTFDISTLEKRGDRFLINLPIDQQPENPQAVLPTQRDRFRQFIKE